ncbi:hypothetical protein FGRMN_3000 [Fusarium graminum]|nr:hypothetical protein FGRMN_3000 [Fusarium graminum]
MSDLINQAFTNYDLLSPNDDVILPSVWERIAKPGMVVTITIWPMENIPALSPPPLSQASSQVRTSTLPAGWEVKSDTSEEGYLENYNIRTDYGYGTDHANHHSSNFLPLPPNFQSTAPGQVPQKEVGIGIGFEYRHHHRRHSNNETDHPALPSNKSLWSKRELSTRGNELGGIKEPIISTSDSRGVYTPEPEHDVDVFVNGQARESVDPASDPEDLEDYTDEEEEASKSE